MITVIGFEAVSITGFITVLLAFSRCKLSFNFMSYFLDYYVRDT